MVSDNLIGVVGKISKVEVADIFYKIKEIGISYGGKIKIQRSSEVEDELMFMVPHSAKNDLEDYKLGGKILIAGEVQTVKNPRTGQTLLFILVDYIGHAPKGDIQNDLTLTGEIARHPVYRSTPGGKVITELLVKVVSKVSNESCYIPCICWQEMAREASGWHIGDVVALEGRLQSRAYIKKSRTVTVNGEPTKEIRTTYEVSVKKIRRAEK